MRKKLITGAAVSAAVLVAATPTMSALALPLPTYRANEKTGFVISRIIPAEQYMEFKYERISAEFEGVDPFRIYVDYGENITDYDLYMMQYAWHAPGATMAYAGLASKLLSDWNTGTAVVTGNMLQKGADLTQTTRLEYNVATTQWFNMVGRADYSRCVNSSVYRSGVATECRVEERDDGKLQYQPYTADGERVEIPAAEDAILTAKTDNWVPNSGIWGDEWYEPSDDGGGDNGDSDDGGNGGGSGNGGDNGQSGTGGDGGSENGGDSQGDADAGNDTDDSNNSANDNGGGANSGGSGKDADSNNVDNSSANSDDTGSKNTDSNDASGNSSVENSDGTSGDGGSSSGSNANEVMQTVASLMGNNTYSAGVYDTENASENASENTDNAAENTDGGGENAAEEDLAVPELGKETGVMPGWLSAFLVALGTFAAIMLWWLLFFGRHKTKEERKEEES